jgi:hypothetical protein
MKCFVCGSNMRPYFSKDFNVFNLKRVEYEKCDNCGFVASKTHFEMSSEEWSKLNVEYHSVFMGSEFNDDDHKWLDRLNDQAKILSKLHQAGIINLNKKGVDYGCGDGHLVDLIKKEGYQGVMKYDKYMMNTNSDYLSEKELKSSKFNTVINTSVLEHIRDYSPIEEINSLFTEDGVFILHTLVKENIDPDPDWFYLLAVHTAFYSNKSMQLIFDRMKFESSLYHVKSRMWFWFKKDSKQIESLPESYNRNSTDPEDIFIYKKGFVDYWK